MLPSFRFLFAAILFSMSILVFGLGAAALLRTAHEEFASNPFWHAAPETTFAQQSEATRPVLALLRVDPVPAEQQGAPDDVPSVAAPGEPTSAIEVKPPAKAAGAKSISAEPDESIMKKRQQARRAAQRRRIAARARAARQAAQQAADPFAQPLAQPAAAQSH